MKDLKKIIDSFKVKDSLNPKIWDGGGNTDYILKDKVRTKLLEIANEFIEFLGVDIFISDITMTGSLANYNWSEYSDIDLHITADFEQYSKKERELYEEFFKLKKTLFNTKHDITIYGYEVELYVQNESEPHTSTGVYSVLYDEWITKPSPVYGKIDFERIKQKSRHWMDTIDIILDNIKDEPLDEMTEKLDLLKDKIKKFRSTGLDEYGEFSDENLVFKVLRRNGYIEKIFDFQSNYIDKTLSLDEMYLKIKHF
jgi:hypothetical protein